MTKLWCRGCSTVLSSYASVLFHLQPEASIRDLILSQYTMYKNQVLFVLVE
ncbi:hypothetical protein Lalb_Chr01g0021171 [Lupinus albus]|uniref:Uncharacterized protein n=1 Tax=Lupinus albus TaxID=3870 RepID=A0A6A4RB66_LUPAL|nr:hypothetical protein Lalb_Chr01g0021171 [Lupinus albus]